MISGSTTYDISQILDRAFEQYQHAGDLLKKIGSVIARQRQLAQDAPLAPLNNLRIDKEKLKSGVSVIQQISLLGDREDLKHITLVLAKVVKEVLPDLGEDLDHLSELIQKGRLVPSDYFKPSAKGAGDMAEVWGNKLKVSPSNAAFIMSLVSRVVLEQRAKEVRQALGAFEWEKGYCPICGNYPSIALIEEEGGKRFLYCSACGQNWRYTRVVCPYCEKEASKGMDYFYIENKTQESAFVCDECNKYLVTLYRAGNLFARDMDVSAIGLIHLDILMQDKGYEPMTACVWNVLK
ncbi:MAG: formate dehydrogenase accessory protein FdhE [Smithella sp.]|jgi:FdhE protein|nr:formate dehydrogenase accessory protein FdhE [Smithella sp.]